MSMHLEGPGLTTTSTKKRPIKITKAKQAQIESDWRDRNQRLKAMGLPKETLEQYMEWLYGRGKAEKKTKDNRNRSSLSVTDLGKGTQEANKDRLTTHIPSVSYTPSATACAKKPPNTYTGTEVLGIAVLHKSCLQPVFSKKEATEVAKMRR